MLWKLITGDGRLGFTPVEALDFGLDRPPLRPAVTGHAHSDTGYILLGLIIERAPGRGHRKEETMRLEDRMVLVAGEARFVTRPCQAKGGGTHML